MSNFDTFIEAADRDLDVDTSTRASEGCLTPPSVNSTARFISASFSNSDGIKKYTQQRQLTPKKSSSQDHPLKEDRMSEPPVLTRSTAKLNKRRSLIQPIAVPKTPESTETRKKGLNINKSAPATLLVSRIGSSESIKDHLHSSPKSPSYVVQEESYDISIILQKLANKELELLEGKQRIEELKKLLASEEQTYKERANELEELKEFVSDQFKSNTSDRPDSALSTQHIREPVRETAQGLSPINSEVERLSTKAPEKEVQSVWSKPLAIFNQFDQIIQQELERTLNWDESSEERTSTHPKREKNSSERHTHSKEARKTKPEEQSVTKSIWNFVNDMKTGLLGTDDEGQLINNTPVDRNSDASASDPGASQTLGLNIKEFKKVSAIDETVTAWGENKLRFVDGSNDDTEAIDGRSNREVEMREL